MINFLFFRYIRVLRGYDSQIRDEMEKTYRWLEKHFQNEI